MADSLDFNIRIDALEKSLQAKLGLRGKTFEARLKRAGRLLPKRVHRAGAVISRARSYAQHPKLARVNDPSLVNTAFNVIETHLETINPAERRKDAVLNFLGRTMMNLVLVGIGIYLLLRWQGVI